MVLTRLIMILSTSDCSRKSHPRSSPTDTQSVKSMLDHLSSTKADPALTSRLTLSLKQLKARTTTIREVLQAFPTLPWQQVSEDSAFIKRPKLEPVVIIDEIEDMDQVVVVETVKVLAVNEACITKRWGKGTFSKECIAALDKGVRAYMEHMLETVNNIAASRILSHTDNFPCHIVTSNPQSTLSRVDQQERKQHLEQLKAAMQAKSSKNPSSDLRQAIRQAMCSESSADSQSATPESTVREAELLSVWPADVKVALELDPKWRRSGLLQRMLLQR